MKRFDTSGFPLNDDVCLHTRVANKSMIYECADCHVYFIRFRGKPYVLKDCPNCEGAGWIEWRELDENGDPVDGTCCICHGTGIDIKPTEEWNG